MRLTRLQSRLRLWSGLVIALYATVHFSNLALGIFSIEAMDAMHDQVILVWRSAVGTVLLYGALIIHFSTAILSLHRRTTLRMPAWEASQVLLGLCIPPALLGHALSARLGWQIADLEMSYRSVVAAIWQSNYVIAKQTALLLVVWSHLCIGLHYWLRLKRWYSQALPALYAVAILVPVLAILGFVDAGLTITPQVKQAGGMLAMFPDRAAADPNLRELIRSIIDRTIDGYWLTLGLIAVLVYLRQRRRKRARATYMLHHSNGTSIEAPVGRSLLEAIRSANIPHASICGGRARCTTCRVRIGKGGTKLEPPSRLEADALARIGAQPDIRLACQVRPRGAVWITPMVPPGAFAPASHKAIDSSTREQRIVSLFVDLRGSTLLAETRLPFDVVFVLNQFFAGMSDTLTATNGHYAQFMGDGLLALYGLREDPERACKQALHATALMQRAVNVINTHLADELDSPLRIGIGVHLGTAIVGSMGPPETPLFSAIGDDVNIAARLEQQCKHFDCTLVVSKETVDAAGLDFTGVRLETLQVRGRGRPVLAYIIDDPLHMPGVSEPFQNAGSGLQRYA